jgi:hypothetical protein
MKRHEIWKHVSSIDQIKALLNGTLTKCLSVTRDAETAFNMSWVRRRREEEKGQGFMFRV